MTRPVVAQCGWSTVEFYEDSAGYWHIHSAGQRIGQATAHSGGVRVDTEHIAFGRATLEQAAVTLAVKLHDDYLVLGAKRPVRFSDAGFASGEVA